MNIQQLALVAGTISSLIFACSHFPMLWKMYCSKNVRSYSYVNVIMVNIGNLIYWFYVASLPLGPVWVLHAFYTVSSILLLIMYIRYRRTPSITNKAKRISPTTSRSKVWGRKLEMPSCCGA